jgi:hypothetical protein
MGSIVFETSEEEGYIAKIGKPWYSKEEYEEYLHKQPRLCNDAAHGLDVSFFDAMGTYLGKFDEKIYDGKSLNEISRDLP